MWTTVVVTIAILGIAFVNAQDLRITGILVGQRSGQPLPKALELMACSYIPDLSQFTIQFYNNGATSVSSSISFPFGSVDAGRFIYIASGTTSFSAWFGFTPNYSSLAGVTHDGNDVAALYKGAVIVDQYGVIGVDGTGTAWDYSKGWAARLSGKPAQATFVQGDWEVHKDAFNGVTTTNAAAALPYPVGRYTCTVSSSSPTKQPTGSPTTTPSGLPTSAPTKVPTTSPTMKPSNQPTDSPTDLPTSPPTPQPTASPTAVPTEVPTMQPTEVPTMQPTEVPTMQPTEVPTMQPTQVPTMQPTLTPTASPTQQPSKQPSTAPSKHPTIAPSNSPTATPTKMPSSQPTLSPTALPTPLPTTNPTQKPSTKPTSQPTSAKKSSSRPSTFIPTRAQSKKPTKQPTRRPTRSGKGN